MELNLIIQGDCVNEIARLPQASVDLVFADPPFNIGYDYDVYEDRKERPEYLKWSERWIAGVHRVLKPDGTFWLAIGDEYAAELKILSQEIGFHCRSWVIWYYTFGVNCTNKFTRSHAHLFHFVMDPERFTFRSEALENRVPSARQLVYGDKRANPRGRLPDDTWLLRPQDLSGCLTPSESTWYFPRVAGTFKERAGFHGCQMPEQLLGRIIRTCSNVNDIVMDPFSGSATTLAVAKKLGRRYLGIELSADYVERGTNRLADVRLGDPLDGAEEPALSAPTTAAGRRLGQPKVKKSRRSPKPVDEEGSVDPNAAAETELVTPLVENGLRQAFRQSYRGYSIDRLLADPKMNADFAAACTNLSLPGDVRCWNRMLLRLRKAGRLADIPTHERTELSWFDCDDFLFASEIALQQMVDRGCESLDELLCDPALAAEFDRIAQSFAPGFTPFQYRWAALKLRKEAKIVRARATAMTPIPLRDKVKLADLSRQQWPDQSGIYLITGEDGSAKKLYGGGAINLRRRFEGQFTPTLLDHWTGQWSAATMYYAVAPDPNPTELLAYQTMVVREHRPALNWLHFALDSAGML